MKIPNLKQAKNNNKNLRPDILTHPHIPKPLHGLNPRSIMGNEAWEKVKKETSKKTGYTCYACGVHRINAKKHPWLEAHEAWEFNYESGICTVPQIVPLCHYCHKFIHSGLLAIDHTSKEIKKEILTHGFTILNQNNLSCFAITYDLAILYNVDTLNVMPYDYEFNPDLNWLDFKLSWNGKIYDSKFKSYSEWKKFYSTKGI